MVKVRLIGSRNTQWFINGKSYPGEYVVDLPQQDVDFLLKEEKERGRKTISEFVENKKEDVPKPVPVEVKEEKKVVPLEKSEEYLKLKLLNKEQQVELLKELGVEKIPKLESGRIKAILEAQK